MKPSVAIHEAAHALRLEVVSRPGFARRLVYDRARRAAEGTAGTVRHEAPAALRRADVAVLYRELAVTLGGRSPTCWQQASIRLPPS